MSGCLIETECPDDYRERIANRAPLMGCGLLKTNIGKIERYFKILFQNDPAKK